MSTKDLKKVRKENDKLKGELSKITNELGSLREQFKKIEQPHETSDDTLQELREANKSLSYLSEDYDSFQTFRQDAKKQIDRLDKWIESLSAKVDEIAGVIQELQDYSFQYNVKIIGLPHHQTKANESAFDTATLCVNLFYQMGIDIEIGSIDTAHRVPTRNKKKPFPIICKFLRRLDKEKVMACRRNAKDVDLVALGFAAGSPEVQDVRIGIFDHLSPSKQALFAEVKKFKTSHNFAFCWVKGGCIYLRESERSNIIRIKDFNHLQNMERMD